MGVWDSYAARLDTRGRDRRATAFRREQRFLNVKMPTSLSYHHAIIDGVERELVINNSDNLDTKTLNSLPGEDIRHGALVEWMGNHWLVTEKDYNNELYTSAKMRQCNYLLRWIAQDGTIVERWSIIEDGTKLQLHITSVKSNVCMSVVVWFAGNGVQKRFP